MYIQCIIINSMRGLIKGRRWSDWKRMKLQASLPITAGARPRPKGQGLTHTRLRIQSTIPSIHHTPTHTPSLPPTPNQHPTPNTQLDSPPLPAPFIQLQPHRQHPIPPPSTKDRVAACSLLLQALHHPGSAPPKRLERASVATRPFLGRAPALLLLLLVSSYDSHRGASHGTASPGLPQRLIVHCRVS
jgi:hypothetical protein